jgi:phage terminase small subunit
MAKENKILEELNENQKCFCREYITDWNITRAYRVAYGTKDSVSAVNGIRLLSNAKINKYIEHIKSHLEEVTGLSKKRVIDEHIKLAFSSISNLHDTWITRKEFETLTGEQKACISEISTSIRRTVQDGSPIDVEYVKIKLYDKQKSLEAISKLMGYDAPEKKELTGKDGQPLIPDNEVICKFVVINEKPKT